MRPTPFKWLLIALMVVSFAGRPWAQVLPVSTQGCGGPIAMTMQSAHPPVTHEAGKIAVDETAAPQNDFGKTKSADCVKNCAAVQVLGLAAMIWFPEVWPQIHSAATEVVLNGHPPKPELAPPIVLG